VVIRSDLRLDVAATETERERRRSTPTPG
jgi:hypothetical protein